MKGDKMNLYLCQFSYQYGNEVYLPYSVGMLWAYAKTFPQVISQYNHKGFVFLRREPVNIAQTLEEPDVVAFSTYVWNWEMSAAVAREIKRLHPHCLIIFGGPQVPDPERLDRFFDAFPFIDIAVHGEGEVTFTEILQTHAQGGDYLSINGLSCKDGTSSARARTLDLNVFPSPYLNGVFEDLFELPFSYQAVWETNRGCPYGCTFCDWGSMTNQKLYQFLDERLIKEVDYFGAKEVSHVYMADANFGILPRDVEIAKYVAQTKIRTGGYPNKMRVNYAKNNPDRVHEIAKILNAVNLDKGITLSVQSMDETTLNTIKRKNLKYDTLASFIKQYQREGIDTVTEVIMGLPGETYESFRDGLDELLEASAHDTLWIYRCTVLPNAPMNEVAYRKLHGIKTVRTPIFLNHTKPASDPVQEYEDTIVETATLCREDYNRCLILAWAVQAFHALNLTQVFAIFARAHDGMTYTAFYEMLLEFAAQRPFTVIGRELQLTINKIEDVFDRGGNWNNVVAEFSSLTWALEEASYLRIVLALDKFFAEFQDFIEYLEVKGAIRIDPLLKEDLYKYQKALVVKWEKSGSTTLILNHSVHQFCRGVLTGEPVALQRGIFHLTITDPYNFKGDKQRYATEILFWGRRGGKTTYRTVEEQEISGRVN